MNPAKEIGRYPEIGTLGVGKAADIAVLREETGVFALKDAWAVEALAAATNPGGYDDEGWQDRLRPHSAQKQHIYSGNLRSSPEER